jgi:hypothetical protein
MFTIPSETLRALSRTWIGRLAPYRQHHNAEHREALVADALAYAGLRLEGLLDRSSYWQRQPLVRRAAVLLFLVDRGVVDRVLDDGRYVYEARPQAETWVEAQPLLAPHLRPTHELLAAMRSEQAQRRPATDAPTA